MISRRWAWGLALACLAFLAVFFILPVLDTLAGGFVHEGRPTADFARELFRNPIYREGLRNSFNLAAVTTLMVVVIALPPAVVSAYCTFPGKGLANALILAPIILPPFVGAVGIGQMLGRYGALNAVLVRLGFLDWSNPIDWLGQGKFWAVAVTQALHLYPIFYLNVSTALANVDPAMQEAAANLGAGPWQRFRRVTLPLIAPGLFAGGAIVFIWAFTELGAPLMFDYPRVTAVQIYDGVKDIGRSPLPYVLVLVMLGASLGIYFAGKMLLLRHAGHGSYRTGTPAATQKLGGWRAAAALLLFLAVIGAAILPHLGVILTSLSRAWYRTIAPSSWTLAHYRDALGHGMTFTSIRNSLRYASLAMGLDLVLGTVIALLVVRSRLRWRGALDALAMMPLAVPGLVLAFGYLSLSQPGRLLGAFNPAEDPAFLLVIAYAVRRLPYVVRAVSAGLQQTPVALEESAQNLGCPPLQTIRRVTLPLIGANLVAGAMLAFSFAMLEVADSLMLAQRQVHYPITKALFDMFQILGQGRYIAAALGVWAMLFLMVTITGTNTLLGRKMGALFRI